MCILIIAGVFIGAGLCFDYVSNQITTLIQEKENAIAECQALNENLEKTCEDLDQTKKELIKVKKELDQAKATIETQVIEIEGYIQAIEDEEAKWRRRYEKYPVATEAWIAMKVNGWNDIACAGIMGNLMAETGGTGTLHLDWDSNGDSGYGLVQWIGSRRTAIKNKYGTYPSVKEQVQFIHDELYGINGVPRQVTGNQLDAIMNAETPEECAYAFACYYERCAEQYRSIRRGFARKAYEYFTS